MAPKESSPLLPSRQGEHEGGDAVRRRNRLRRALFVAVPVAAVMLVLVCWHIAASHHRGAAATSTATPGAPSTSAPAVVVPSETSAPVVTTEAPVPQLTEAEILTLTPPFVSRLHPIPPRLISMPGRAIPTNAFWTNLLIGDGHGLNYGAGEVTLSPYTVRSVPKRLEISYGDSRRLATNASVQEYFNVDASFTGYSKTVNQANGATALLGDGNSTTRHVAAFDPLSVTVQYRFGDDADQWMKAVLVRGSPYVTVEYQRLLPVLEFNATTVLSVNGEEIKEADPSAPASALQQWTAQRFEIDVLVYGIRSESNTTNTMSASADDIPIGLARQKWLLYFGEPRTLRLQFANEKDYRPYNYRGELTTPTNVRLVDSDFYTGAARLTVVPVSDDVTKTIQLLDEAAHVYPVASSVKYAVQDDDSAHARGDVTFCWTTKQFDPVVNGSKQELLMLANPHHVATFADLSSATEDVSIGDVDANGVETPGSDFEVLSHLGHRTVKSYMTAVRGSCWHLTEDLPATGFDAADDSDDVSMPPVPDHLRGEIAAALALDSNYTPVAQDPYYFGKEIARQVRLALIADKLGDHDARDALISQVESWVTPWLLGANGDHFVYERSWGGLCSLNGLKGVFWMTDFGNGWYNDHHFHYGYFLYAVAVVAKFRPNFAEQHRAAVMSIARDIASPLPEDRFFPLARHFSWYDGHSFASGVYTLEGGKSQESVSEAVNAYYGVFLAGRAFGVRAIEHIGRLLLTLEARAARTYWQMPSDSTIYEPVFAANKMTGQVAATKVSYTTWFGPQPEHMHLINMIPFTPITPAFISPDYVRDEYPVLQKQAFDRVTDPIEDRWRGYADLDLAIIDPVHAWDEVRKLTFFDDGSSLTNSLYWIATRAAAAGVDVSHWEVAA